MMQIQPGLNEVKGFFAGWFLDSEEPYKQTFYGLVRRIQAIGLCQILVLLNLQYFKVLGIAESKHCR